MAKGVITDVIDIKNVTSQIDVTLKGLERIAVKIDEINAGMAKTGKGSTGSTSGGKSSGSYDAEKAQAMELDRTLQKLRETETSLSIEIERNKQRLSERRKEIAAAVKAEQMMQGSIEQMEQELKQLEKQYYKMAPAQRQLDEALKNNITSLRNNIKEVKMATGDMRVNVGNYRQSLDGMTVATNNAGNTTNKVKNIFNNFSKTFNEGNNNVGKMEVTLTAIKQTISSMPGPVGAAASVFEKLGGQLKLGVIGIGLAALTAVIYGITKAYEALGRQQDEIIDKNISYMRSMAQLKGKLQEFYTWSKAESDNRSETEKSFANAELKRIQARESAMQKFAASRKKIQETVSNVDERNNQLNKAAIELKDELNKIDAATTSVTGKIATEKIKEATSIKEVTNVWDEYTASMVAAQKTKEAIASGTFIGPIQTVSQAGLGTGELAAMPKAAQPFQGEGMIGVPNAESSPASPSLDRYTEADLAADAAAWGAKFSIAQEYTQKIDALVTASFSNRFAELDKEAQKDEANKTKELERAKGNKGQIEEINKRYAAKEKERDKERRRLEVEQAKYKKASGIVGAIINTAVAVTGMLANPGGILGIVLAALTAVTGAAEIAMIASQPIPSYAKGRKGGKAEFANVGEKGVEKIITRSGEEYFTPGTSTLAYLPEGAEVVPHHKLMEQARLAAFGHSDFTGSAYDFQMVQTNTRIEETNRKLDILADVIKNKREVHMSFDKRGFATSVRNGATWEHYVNNNVRL